VLDTALARIGAVIGKPRGWERVVRALAPPARFSNAGVTLSVQEDGYTFPVDRGTLLGWSVHFFGTYEPEVRAVMREHLHTGDVAFDVGANVGWHALMMASRVGAGGRVCAFEPNETTRRRLIAAIEDNALSNVVVDARAVSDRVGAAGFNAPPAGHVWDGTGRLSREVTGTSIECTTLDAFAESQQIGRVSFIKIDVEGWELAVLRGAERLLQIARPVVVFEYDPAYVSRSGGTGKALMALLARSGYEVFLLHPRRRRIPVSTLPATAGNYLALPKRSAV
jgi:FkbM family methyltransferase